MLLTQRRLNKLCTWQETNQGNQKNKTNLKKTKLLALEKRKKEEIMNSLIKDRTIRDIVKLYKTEEERKEINDSLIKD